MHAFFSFETIDLDVFLFSLDKTNLQSSIKQKFH